MDGAVARHYEPVCKPQDPSLSLPTEKNAMSAKADQTKPCSADFREAKHERAEDRETNEALGPIDRRSLLTGVMTAGALGAAAGVTSLGTPQTAEARSARRARALFNPLKKKGPNAKGDGTTDDAAALQEVIDQALAVLVDEADPSGVNWDHREATIDLQGQTYLIREGLKIDLQYNPQTASGSIMTRIRLVNGTILANLNAASQKIALLVQPDSTSASYREYPEVTLEHVRVQSVQGPPGSGHIGVQLERGLRCSLLNCAIEERNIEGGSVGFDKNLVLRGCQICSFIDCHFSGGQRHVVFEELENGTPNTDCRFYGCSFAESEDEAIYSSQSGTVDGVNAAQCLFDGCTIESAGSGAASLVSLTDTRNMKFRACRFENDSSTVPLVSLSKGAYESTDTHFIDCNFSGRGEFETTGGAATSDGYCIHGDADVTGTAIIANVFPSTRHTSGAYWPPPVHLPAGYEAAANTNLANRNNVETVAVSSSPAEIDCSKSIHDITANTAATFNFVNTADGMSITVLVRGSAPSWSGLVHWADGAAPTFVEPTIYTFRQIGGVLYGSGQTGFA